MAEAQTLAIQDFTGAVALLEKTVRTHAEDPMAGAAQLLLASLEFEHGQHYAQAYAAYDVARQRYPQAFSRQPENVRRFNLLDETRAADYQPLYRLDAARESSQPIERLEALMAEYPATYVAGRAVEEMCSVLQKEEPGVTAMAALEQAQDRCSNPLAVAQLHVALGDAYWGELHDSGKARDAYTAAIQTGHVALARLAQEGLSRIEASESVRP